jgi:hypothetical protein
MTDESYTELLGMMPHFCCTAGIEHECHTSTAGTTAPLFFHGIEFCLVAGVLKEFKMCKASISLMRKSKCHFLFHSGGSLSYNCV